MQVTFYNFTKRKNSIAIPNNSGVTLECTLKDECSKYKPTLIIRTTEEWNYARFQGLYYYVSDIVYKAQNLYEYELTMDKYASGREDILNTTAFVQYSSTTYNNMLADTRLSTTTANLQTSESDLSSMFKVNNKGYYIVNMIGKVGTLSNETSPLGVSTLLMEADDLYSMIDYMQTDRGEDGLVQYLYGVSLQMIQSVTYVPFEMPISQGQLDYVVLNGIDMTFRGKMVTQRYSYVNLSTLPINRPFNDYRDYLPNMALYLPFIGTQVLDSTNYINANTISVLTFIDYSTATGYYELRGGKHHEYYAFEFGSRQPVSTSSVNPIGELTKTVGSVAQFGYGVMGGSWASIASGVDSLFNATIDSVKPQYNTVGSFSSGLMSYLCDKHLRLYVYSMNTCENPSNMSNQYGRPLGQVKTIRSLSRGYVQTVNAHVSSALPFELGLLLDNGLYIE